MKRCGNTKVRIAQKKAKKQSKQLATNLAGMESKQNSKKAWMKNRTERSKTKRSEQGKPERLKEKEVIRMKESEKGVPLQETRLKHQPVVLGE